MSESKHVGCIRYSHELKLEITKRYLSEQTSVRKLSEEYGISFEAVRRTVIKYKPEALRLFFRNDISLTRMKKTLNHWRKKSFVYGKNSNWLTSKLRVMNICFIWQVKNMERIC